jgi:hypothetical protein
MANEAECGCMDIKECDDGDNGGCGATIDFKCVAGSNR